MKKAEPRPPSLIRNLPITLPSVAFAPPKNTIRETIQAKPSARRIRQILPNQHRAALRSLEPVSPVRNTPARAPHRLPNEAPYRSASGVQLRRVPRRQLRTATPRISSVLRITSLPRRQPISPRVPRIPRQSFAVGSAVDRPADRARQRPCKSTVNIPQHRSLLVQYRARRDLCDQDGPTETPIMLLFPLCPAAPPQIEAKPPGERLGAPSRERLPGPRLQGRPKQS